MNPEPRKSSQPASKEAVGPILRQSASPLPSATWISSDPLGKSLHDLRMSGVFYGVSEFSAPWGLEIPPMPNCLVFHIVTVGECLLFASNQSPMKLRPGSLALVPRVEGHGLASAADVKLTNLFDTERYAISDRYELMILGGGGAQCRMICGAVRLDHPSAQHLVQLLPCVLNVDIATSEQSKSFQSILDMIAAEAEQPKPGGEAVLTRLADILVIQALRLWIAQDPLAQKGWLGALRDPQIGQALASIHSRPEARWTVESMAEEAAMSRSAFAAKFTKLIGETPIQYLRAWKMKLAAMELQQRGATVSELAFRFGYNSEAAFSRAFKKEMGVPPSAMKAGDQ